MSFNTAAKTVETIRRFRRKNVRGTVVCGEALKYLKTQESGSAALVFLDPPFNLGKFYSKEHPDLDRRQESDYEAWFTEVLNESSRILMHGGTLYLYHLPRWALKFGWVLDNQLQFRHWVAIAMKNGFVRGRRLVTVHRNSAAPAQLSVA